MGVNRHSPGCECCVDCDWQLCISVDLCVYPGYPLRDNLDGTVDYQDAGGTWHPITDLVSASVYFRRPDGDYEYPPVQWAVVPHAPADPYGVGEARDGLRIWACLDRPLVGTWHTEVGALIAADGDRVTRLITFTAIDETVEVRECESVTVTGTIHPELQPVVVQFRNPCGTLGTDDIGYELHDQAGAILDTGTYHGSPVLHWVSVANVGDDIVLVPVTIPAALSCFDAPTDKLTTHCPIDVGLYPTGGVTVPGPNGEYILSSDLAINEDNCHEDYCPSCFPMAKSLTFTLGGSTATLTYQAEWSVNLGTVDDPAIIGNTYNPDACWTLASTGWLGGGTFTAKQLSYLWCDPYALTTNYQDDGDQTWEYVAYLTCEGGDWKLYFWVKDSMGIGLLKLGCPPDGDDVCGLVRYDRDAWCSHFGPTSEICLTYTRPCWAFAPGAPCTVTDGPHGDGTVSMNGDLYIMSFPCWPFDHLFTITG